MENSAAAEPLAASPRAAAHFEFSFCARFPFGERLSEAGGCGHELPEVLSTHSIRARLVTSAMNEAKRCSNRALQLCIMFEELGAGSRDPWQVRV